MNLPPVLGTYPSDHVVCFDFDGVLAVGVWPDPGIGDPIPEGIEMFRAYVQRGYRVFIHTSRHWADQELVERWLLANTGVSGVPVICGKPLAGVYIDDRGWRFEPAEISADGYARGGDDEWTVPPEEVEHIG